MSLGGLLLIVALAAASAFLSLAEIALIGISKLRLRHMVNRGVKGAKMVQELVSRIDQVITTILFWSNFINAGLASLVAAACVLWLGEQFGVIVASLISGTVILLFTDILPKIYASGHADRVAVRVAPAMKLLVSVFTPVSQSLIKMVYATLRLFGVKPPERSPLVTEEEIRIMIEVGKEQGVLNEQERTLLHRIFEFGDLKVEDAMIPRDKMVAVPETATHEEVLTVLTEKGHSRIPVYRETPDRITGIIYAQEMLHIWREGWLIVLQDLIRPPYEVKSNVRVAELLREFQRRRLQIAIVVDEQGKALGLVTLEDLIEEIVGEIHEDPV